MIDVLLMLVLGLPGVYLGALALADEDRRIAYGAGAASLLVASTMFYLLRDAWGGAGPGKRAFGLRVVHLRSGAPCTGVRAAARMAGAFAVAAVPYAGWAIDPLAVVLTGGGRRITDVLLDTQVVDGRPGPG